MTLLNINFVSWGSSWDEQSNCLPGQDSPENKEMLMKTEEQQSYTNIDSKHSFGSQSPG